MTAATVRSLSAKERALIADTQRDALRSLDEDALVELLTRVRRARDKYVQLHRREVAERVTVARGRGTVSSAPRRSADKAEVFEDALARVSASLAKAARQSAAALKAERLAAARGTSGAPAAEPVAPADPATRRPKAKARTPIERKVAASSRAAGAKRQAKRDAR